MQKDLTALVARGCRIYHLELSIGTVVWLFMDTYFEVDYDEDYQVYTQLR